VSESTDDEQTAMSLAAANITLTQERRVADAAGSQAEQRIPRVMGRGCGAETNISNEGKRKKVKGAALAAELAKMAEAEAAVRAKQFEVAPPPASSIGRLPSLQHLCGPAACVLNALGAGASGAQRRAPGCAGRRGGAEDAK
jgi:hypothetical protein